MINKFKLTVVHVAHPNPMATRCRSVHVHGVTAGQKTVENRGWAAGPSGRRAVAERGPRAAGPLGRGGPWAAGRWAVGLLLAKPNIIIFELQKQDYRHNKRSRNSSIGTSID